IPARRLAWLTNWRNLLHWPGHAHRSGAGLGLRVLRFAAPGGLALLRHQTGGGGHYCPGPLGFMSHGSQRYLAYCARRTGAGALSAWGQYADLALRRWTALRTHPWGRAVVQEQARSQGSGPPRVALF